MKENNSNEHIGDGGFYDTCATDQQCCGSEYGCLVSTVVCIQGTNVLKVDDLSVAGENGRKNDSDNTSVFYLDTRIFSDTHVLADRSHIMPCLLYTSDAA